jgi:thimet oligopeptidase
VHVRLQNLVTIVGFMGLVTLSMPSVPLAAELTPGASTLLVVSPEAFKDTCVADIDRARERAAAFLRSKGVTDGATALDEYDSAIALLADASARASLARSVHPDEAMRDAAAFCETEVEKATTELTLNRGIYDRMASLAVPTTDTGTTHYVQKTLRDFRRAGVDKDDATRAKIRTLRDELVKLGQQFDENIASDVRTLDVDPKDLDGLPDDFKRSHPVQPNGKVQLTTNNTDYQPFLTYSTSAPARAAIWKLYRQRGHPKNVPVLKRMLEARQELATLLGFPTWADYITGDKMIGTKQNVGDFIDRIVNAAETRMKADYAAVLARRRRDVAGAASVDAWDSSYYQEKVKAEQYNFDSQAVRPYFEYSRVKAGVMDITSRMFGITYRPVKDAVVWHADVDVYDVLEGTKLLGRIYLDMFPRDHKYKHYAQFTLTNGKSGRMLPEGVLVCNFPKPGAEPALMQHSDVETLFHEFGHLLHHVLGGHTQWAGVAGVATEWDFVEAPSQMLEEWVWTPETLQTFAKHYKTGEAIPAALVTRMRAADEFGKGLFVRQQMFYASLSLQLHSRDPKGIDMPKLVGELQERITPYRFVENTFFEESFTHLNGYSAIYYTYMWSLVIAKDMFTVFNRAGLMDRDVALRYRGRVLEPGGSQPAADLVRQFLDRPYSFKAFEDWLNAN